MYPGQTIIKRKEFYDQIRNLKSGFQIQRMLVILKKIFLTAFILQNVEDRDIQNILWA
jgi:hypothetical protein